MTKSEFEIWREHPEIVGIEVSTLGRVITLDRVVSSENGTRFLKGRILKQNDNGAGYLVVSISTAGKVATKTVHRLVARTFLSNPNGFPMVNHKNCDRADNRASNLEWCSNSYNQKYRNKNGVSQTEALGLPLFAINLETLKILHFRSQREASRMLGVDQSSIVKVIKGKLKQTGGYWFTNADDNKFNTIKDRHGKMIDGVFVKNSDLEG